jgi:prepilin-type N-terminal cleavage/methylation domain-containing protein
MQERNSESCWKKDQNPGMLPSGRGFNPSDSGCGKCQSEVSKCLGIRGFTLLEVLVVLVLLATISAVVGPSLGRV